MPFGKPATCGKTCRREQLAVISTRSKGNHRGLCPEVSLFLVIAFIATAAINPADYQAFLLQGAVAIWSGGVGKAEIVYHHWVHIICTSTLIQFLDIPKGRQQRILPKICTISSVVMQVIDQMELPATVEYDQGGNGSKWDLDKLSNSQKIT